MTRIRRILLALALLGAAPVSAQTVFISGTVFSGETGRTLPNMTVAAYTVSGNVAATTQTDVQGRYLLALAPASYRVLAYDNSGAHATSFFPNSNSFETSALLTPTPTEPLSNINFQLPRGFRVSGRVDSATTFMPLPNMTVAAYNLDGSRRGHTRTNSGGVYSLVLPAGDYKFAAYDENLQESIIHGVEFYNRQRTFEAANTVSITTDFNGINFALTRGGKVTGKVVDQQSRNGLGNITLLAYNLAGEIISSTSTNAAGEFNLVLPDGQYKFVAIDPSRKYATSFFRSAANFESAPSFTVGPSQSLNNIEFELVVFKEDRPTVLFVAVAANTSGAGNTIFQTDVWIHNPTAEFLNVTVTYLPPGQDNSARTGVPVLLRPKQQVWIENVLGTLLTVTGGGGLKFEAPGPFRVMSRTYNKPANAEVTGTFGLAIPGLPLSASVSRGTVGSLANNASSRSNLGILNPQTAPITVKIELFDSEGTLLAEGSKSLAPLEWFQANTIFTYLSVNAPIDNAYAVLTSPDGSFFAYGSLVDQKSGDGTIIQAVGD